MSAAAAYLGLLKQSADIYQSNTTIPNPLTLAPRTAYGNTPHVAGVACRVDPIRNPAEQMVSGEIFEQLEKLHLPPGTEIRITDQVVIGGERFQVMDWEAYRGQDGSEFMRTARVLRSSLG